MYIWIYVELHAWKMLMKFYRHTQSFNVQSCNISDSRCIVTLKATVRTPSGLYYVSEYVRDHIYSYIITFWWFGQLFGKTKRIEGKWIDNPLSITYFYTHLFWVAVFKWIKYKMLAPCIPVLGERRGETYTTQLWCCGFIIGTDVIWYSS